MKFQFNKTELQRLKKQLKVREKALPTLKNKESALRSEIKKYKKELKAIKLQLQEENNKLHAMKRLYAEFPMNIVTMEEILVDRKKIAGVRIPVYNDVKLKISHFSFFNSPTWFLEGVEMLKQIVILEVKLKIEERRIAILERARKKTTQKVNLYEKVQIPAFEDAILKIKRFLEDIENLDKAGSKIVKKRLEAV